MNRPSLSVSTRAGQPLAVLGAILLIWAAVRAVLWQSPFPLVLPPLPELVFGKSQFAAAPGVSHAGSALVRAPTGFVAAPISPPSATAAPELAEFYDPAALASRGQPLLASTVHQLMWLAAHDSPATTALSSAGRYSTPPVAGPLLLNAPAEPGRQQRWSVSGWAFLRQGSGGTPVLGGGIPAYGASQTGGVLAYRLSPGSARQPAAYLRVTTALARAEDVEMALGLSVRPVPRLPVAVLAEGRARRSGDALLLRPAVLAVTQLPRLDLPHGFAAEAYGQVGYVSGLDATGFADGQVRVTRQVAAFQPGTIRTGAGAWGGAQKGAARLDIGPTAQLDLRLADLPARLALDYRARVAGSAAPGSGVALTLSTGF